MMPLPMFMASLLLIIHLPVSADQCPTLEEGAEEVVTDTHHLSFSTEPRPIAIGEHFDALVVVCRSDGTPFEGELAVDADMPDHGHGMNYRAVVEQEAAGRFRARGLMFHMPGKWRFLFTVEDDAGRLTLEAPINVQ